MTHPAKAEPREELVRLVIVVEFVTSDGAENWKDSVLPGPLTPMPLKSTDNV
jgi:hypothetical protein